MKLSELIERLNAIMADKGDMDVYAWPYDGQGGKYEPVLEVGKDILFIEGY